MIKEEKKKEKKTFSSTINKTSPNLPLEWNKSSISFDKHSLGFCFSWISFPTSCIQSISGQLSNALKKLFFEKKKGKIEKKEKKENKPRQFTSILIVSETTFFNKVGENILARWGRLWFGGPDHNNSHSPFTFASILDTAPG